MVNHRHVPSQCANGLKFFFSFPVFLGGGVEEGPKARERAS